MASTLPSPLAAAIGIVPTVLDGVRRLPGRAVQVPVLAVSSALSTMDSLRREYDGLAERGERLVARLRGQAPDSVDELEDRVEDALARTPFATAYDKVEDAVEDAGDAVAAAVSHLSPLAAQGRAAGAAAMDTAEKSVEAVLDAAAAEQVPAAETPKGEPTPKAVEPDSTRVDTAATASVQQTVEAVAQASPAVELNHDELPLPDYDHMTLGSLRGRMRALTVEQLVQIRRYEKAHADRLPIVTMLDNRIAKLATDAGATTSGPVSTSPAPEQQALAGRPAGGVSPATTNAPNPTPPTLDVRTPGQAR